MKRLKNREQVKGKREKGTVSNEEYVDMLNEYDCWFQKRKIEIDFQITEIIVSKIKGVAADQAIKELKNGIDRLLGKKIKISSVSSVSSVVKNEFVIKVTDTQIFINAADENGLLYGVYRFLFLLAQKKIKPGFELTDSPASPLRMINHWDNFDGSIERGYAGKSLFYKNGYFNFNNKRIEDYARLLASIGINRVSINNVNVRDNAKLLITDIYLKKTVKLAAIFRRFGIRLFFAINFGAPWSLGRLNTADPLDPAVIKWWKDRVKLIYKYIPGLAGFLVKADSEGEPGPFQYGRTHADGANMLADALNPYGGEVIWRCFVYNCTQDWRDTKTDRARAVYDHFMPLDGSFKENVILQIKHGPYDFQVREPVTPLFGALKKTRHVMELQITQEYTGHQIDLCYLPCMWEDVINFYLHRMKPNETELKVKDLIGSNFHISDPKPRIEGFAAVVNVGLDENWTGHTLAQANLYGYGRLTWNPSLTAKEIAEEWCELCFTEQASPKVKNILMKSYPAYEKYASPFGVCFMVTPGTHYGPNIEGYEFSRWGTYHRADKEAIGIDRTPSGTGFTSQYSKEIAEMFANPNTCPENLLLFFHRLRYDFKMKNGKTLLQNIYDTHFEGAEEVESMIEEWKALKTLLQEEVFNSVLSRFERQLANAREWRDQINTYFYRKTGIPDEQGRKIFD